MEANSSLRVAIEKAREVNMPKENIERLIAGFEKRKANLKEYVYEGYGPFGVPVVVEVETDNKNRTLSEIKLMFKTNDGNLGDEGSVMYQFEKKGEIELEELIDEERMLELIDMGAEDIDGQTVTVSNDGFKDMAAKIKTKGWEIVRAETVLKSRTPIILETDDQVGKMIDFIEELEESDDVLNVYAGFDYEQTT